MKEQILNYETPEIKILAVNVEKGYATSDGSGGGSEGGTIDDDL